MHDYMCVFRAHKKNPLLIASVAVLLTWLGSLAVMTKTSVWPVFVLQSWKNGFHIGTICTVASDPVQRRQIESTQRFAIQKHKAFQAQADLQIWETKNMLAQVDDAHMQTNCYFFIRQPCGPKITHASILLSDGGRADLAGGAENICNTYTHRLVISLCKSRWAWNICCRRAKCVWVCGTSTWGGGICCALWEMGVRIRHSCCMTFCSVQFPHQSWRKQRRITQW